MHENHLKDSSKVTSREIFIQRPTRSQQRYPLCSTLYLRKTLNRLSG
uniref:Uncharacterized protein n=1 Tax=Arundo donax TaxID=35708 RepID=A0A0A9CRP8_ARUDO